MAAEPLPLRAEGEALADWTALWTAYRSVSRNLTADLNAAGFPSLPEYLALSQLRQSYGQQLRQTDLCHALTMSPSRVNRLLNGLVLRGHVRRQSSSSDRRVVLAVLTPAGSATAEAAAVVFQRTLATSFTSKLVTEPGTLARLLEGLQPQ